MNIFSSIFGSSLVLKLILLFTLTTWFPDSSLAQSGVSSEKPSTLKTLRGILKIDTAAYSKVAKAKLSKAIKIGRDGLTIPLPSKSGKVMMGYAGAYLLIEFPDLKRIGVLDICAGKIIKYISLPEERFKFAAGGQVLLIYLPKAKKFQLWDMKTWTMKAERKFKSERKIYNLSMGLLNHNFAVVNVSSALYKSSDNLGILSLPDCKFIMPKWTPANEGEKISSFLHVSMPHRVSIGLEESGRYGTIYHSGRFSVIDFSNELAPKMALHEYASNSSLALGGNYLISPQNEIYKKDKLINKKDLLAQRLKRHNPHQIKQGHLIVPIAGFEGVAHIAKREGKEGEILIRDLKTLDILSSTVIPNKIHRPFSFSSGDWGIPEVFASAYIQRCVLIGRESKQLTIFPIEVDAQAITKAVRPGSPVSRVINVPKGSKVSIESDHAGASFNPKTNTLKWNIPANFKRGTKGSIILMITDTDGKEKLHVEEIYVP